MRFFGFAALFLAFALIDCGSVYSQTPGRKKVEAAYAFQDKMSADSTKRPEVIKHWSQTALDPHVRRDRDALAIAYGCQGTLELAEGHDTVADSLLLLAEPLFRHPESKAYFLVALSDLERKLGQDRKAMEDYAEILHTMDSMPELNEIEYYRQSGYGEFAYGIVAALGVGKIGSQHPKFAREATVLLRETLQKHPTDALGVMAIVGLEHLDTKNLEEYKFKLDYICSRKADLRKVSDKFNAQFLKE